tara:strand:+ start:4002 stop:4613 length:612 start_codon:yes stop_codon:yes gene_type:complete
MKRCTKCNETKDVAEYYLTKAGNPEGKCKPCRRAYQSELGKKNRARNLIRERAYRSTPEGKEMMRKAREKYVENNREEIRTRKRLWERNRRATSPGYRLRQSTSVAISIYLKSNGSYKTGSCWSVLPYTPEELIEHLAKQFRDGMTLDNYGSVWEVDHIFPQSLLLYDSYDHPNFARCWALDNLQPLTLFENRSKGNKVSLLA